MQKRIIILTKSSKYQNYCVAGIETDTGNWIRLVSEDDEIGGALTDDDIMYNDGTACEILDMVTVECVEEVPTGTQRENVLIDRAAPCCFVKNGTATLDDVLEIHPSENRTHSYIFGSKYSSIKEEYWEERGGDYSLTLVEVEHLAFSRQENDQGTLKLKAAFWYNGKHYENMSVTDPEYYDEAEEDVVLRNAYLVISMGASYNGSYYKFIAKIFPIVETELLFCPDI